MKNSIVMSSCSWLAKSVILRGSYGMPPLVASTVRSYSDHVINEETWPTKQELKEKLKSDNDVYINKNGDVVLLNNEIIDTIEFDRKRHETEVDKERGWRFAVDDNKAVYQGVAKELGYKMKGEGFQKN